MFHTSINYLSSHILLNFKEVKRKSFSHNRTENTYKISSSIGSEYKKLSYIYNIIKSMIIFGYFWNSQLAIFFFLKYQDISKLFILWYRSSFKKFLYIEIGKMFSSQWKQMTRNMKKTHDKHYEERTVLGLVNSSFNLSSSLLFLI